MGTRMIGRQHRGSLGDGGREQQTLAAVLSDSLEETTALRSQGCNCVRTGLPDSSVEAWRKGEDEDDGNVLGRMCTAAVSQMRRR